MQFGLRGLVLSSALAVAGSAFASFDLMLLPGIDGRVYRYDPVNNIQLGSFASGIQNTMIAADDSGNAYLMSSGASAVRSYKYGTGELSGIFTGLSSGRATTYSAGMLVELAGNSVRRYNPTTGATIATNTLDAAVNWRASAVSTGNAFSCSLTVGINTSNTISYTSFRLDNGLSSSLVSTTISVMSGSDLGKMATFVNPITGAQGTAFTYQPTASILNLAYVPLNSSGDFTTAPFSSFSINGTGGFAIGAVMPAVLTGHDGIWVVGQDFTTSTLMRVSRYDWTGSGLLYSGTNTFSAPGGSFAFGSNSFCPTNVIAPEPGTWASMGLGLGALISLKRRPRR